MKFDYYINALYKNGDPELKRRFFIIILWWKISTVIPMNPLEVAELPFDCISEIGGKYYLSLRRVKETSSNINLNNDERVILSDVAERIENRREQTLRISKEIYDMILEYKTFTSEIKRPILFLYPYSRKNYYSSLNDVLEDFSREVIKSYYKVELIGINEKRMNQNQIEMPRLGDTRHLAFVK